MVTHEGDMARSGDCGERSNPRSARLPVFPAGNGADGSAAAGSEDDERSRLPARRPILRPRGGCGTQRACRLVVRGAARRDEADRSLDRFLERRRDRVSVGAPQQTQSTISSTTLLTRVTRIFQKSVFTEATPAARTGHPAGCFAAWAHAAPCQAYFRE